MDLVFMFHISQHTFMQGLNLPETLPESIARSLFLCETWISVYINPLFSNAHQDLYVAGRTVHFWTGIKHMQLKPRHTHFHIMFTTENSEHI